ncbi:hypothetical protein I8H89_02755 [Candidatus Saccharibacteria bacterium]|nr:hypothetical protein [Candidatus Saccharibacteria bacterium]
MGKGITTSQDNVEKKLSKLTADKELLLAGAGIGSGEGQEKERTINQCIVKFNVNVQDQAGSLAVGDTVTMVPEGSAGVQIIRQGRKVDSYVGDLASTLAECMRAGYIYKGEVIEINTASGYVTCRIQGFGRL